MGTLPRISGPIKRLTEITEEISLGKLDVVLDPALMASKDEIGVLATAFSTMTAQLKRLMEDLTAEISERKRIEKALKEKEEYFRLALSAAEMGTWRLDAVNDQDTREAVLNQILGLEAVASTQANIDFMKRIHPDDLAAAGAELERSIREGNMCEAEFRIVRPDGTIRWVRDHSSPFYNEKGEHLFCTGVVHDITDLKKAENALADERKRMETIPAALSYVANECGNDLKKLCSGVPAGNGRLLNCLEKNDSRVSGRCKQALKDVGLNQGRQGIQAVMISSAWRPPRTASTEMR